MSNRGGELSKPIAAIRDPPTRDTYWDGCRQPPPERQHYVGDQTKENKRHPKYLALHALSLARVPQIGPWDALNRLLPSLPDKEWQRERVTILQAPLKL
jgi:hypothetical protein